MTRLTFQNISRMCTESVRGFNNAAEENLNKACTEVLVHIPEIYILYILISGGIDEGPVAKQPFLLPPQRSSGA